ncbi:hypothetical protein [Paramagnetospirillum marisnigri]|uniref:hypothetical protein n=1 Tax=Paramagnetospirillum marisnigri TaxID=1285242 RepID=UPI0012E6F9E6|nr:hypothetical protein [Paramagnetospirillum marisnigri]
MSVPDWIAKCDNLSLLQQGLENAKAHQNQEVIHVIGKRIEFIKENSPIEIAFRKMLQKYEELLSLKNGKATRATRLRPKYHKDGAVVCIEYLVKLNNRTSGFNLLVDNKLANLTCEAIVIENKEMFSEEAVRMSQKRLSRIT